MPKKDVSYERFDKWISNRLMSRDMLKENLTIYNDVLNKMVFDTNML
jgi:hypothetical protein